MAKACLEGKTKGYVNHPQLYRFKESPDPILAINIFLTYILEESKSRGYKFGETKIKSSEKEGLLHLNVGQIRYEWNHYLSKIKIRNNELYEKFKDIDIPEPNPIFNLVEGEVESWEKIRQ